MKDFFDELKIRINNPLIAAFFISLFFCNIKVPLVLFFYKQADLKKDHYDSYLDFIHKTTDTWTLLILPIIFALAYVGLSPFVRGIIESYHARIDAEHVTKMLKDTAGGSIPVEQHREKLAESDKKRLEYVELINQHGTTKIERDALRIEKETLIKEKAALVSIHDKAILDAKKASDDRVKKLGEDEVARVKLLDEQYKVRIDQLTETIGTLRVSEEMLTNQITTDAANHAAEILNLTTDHENAMLELTQSRNETAEHYRDKIEELRVLQFNYDKVLVKINSLQTYLQEMKSFREQFQLLREKMKSKHNDLLMVGDLPFIHGKSEYNSAVWNAIESNLNISELEIPEYPE